MIRVKSSPYSNLPAGTVGTIIEELDNGYAVKFENLENPVPGNFVKVSPTYYLKENEIEPYNLAVKEGASK